MKKKLRNKRSGTNYECRIKHRSAFKIHYSLFIMLLMLLLAACTSKDAAQETADTYTCPMHPTVVADKPGTCPVCGMDLVRKARPGEEVKITEELTKLIKSPNEIVIASIKTIRASYKAMPMELDVNGIVSYDTRNIFTIPARVGGRLEKVYLKYNFQPVTKGQKVAEVYSPELVNAQRELVYLLQNDASNTSLIEAAKSKLILLGATASQVETLVKNQEIIYSFSVYSPYAGYVISESQSAPAAPVKSSAASASDGMGMGGGISASPTPLNDVAQSSTLSIIREGSYVTTGQTLFKVVNSNSIWLEFSIPASSGSKLKVGDEFSLAMHSGFSKSKINFIEPFSDGENFIRIRSYYKGEELLIGQLIKAKFSFQTKETLWLPKDAIYDLGTTSIVFVKERGQYKPKSIETGTRSDGWIEVTKGITSGDEVAINAQYLIDSESFVKPAN